MYKQHAQLKVRVCTKDWIGWVLNCPNKRPFVSPMSTQSPFDNSFSIPSAMTKLIGRDPILCVSASELCSNLFIDLVNFSLQYLFSCLGNI